MQHGRTWLSMLLLLFLTACPPTGQKPVSLNDGVPAKIAFDLDRLDDRGLYGPSDGLRSLGYEFCIPAQQRYIDAVHALDPDIKVYRHSPGSIGCRRDEYLCMGETHDRDWQKILNGLAALPYVEKIIPSRYE